MENYLWFISPLQGLNLRYVLTRTLVEQGPMTIPQLVTALESDGFVLGGRASKTVSDALRWEARRCRVARLGRGRYAPGRIPRETARRIRLRTAALRDEVAGRRLQAPTG